MTRIEDIEAAAHLGVDAVGLVFYSKSRRYVTPEQAQELVSRLPAFVTVTGLFLDPSSEDVQSIVEVVRVDLLQFHGSETPEFCRSFNRRYIKAVPMGSQVDICDYARKYSDAAALLLDSHAVGQKGGTGMTFEWSRVPQFDGPPLILAGGLKPSNVAAAIRSVHPYGVDVSSGVESGPGVKDARRMSQFISEVNSVPNL